MWTRTRVSERLGLDVPIVQGPFGGGNSTSALAAAVSNAGGLGSFGAVTLTPADVTRVIREIAALTARPFAINLWVPIAGQDDAQVSREAFARSVARVAPHLAALALPEPAFPEQFAQPFEAQACALIEARPPVFSFVMGVPDRAILDDARTRGIVTIGTATTVEEAVAIAEAGADLVVASGSDAGGHRGSFLRPVEDSLVGTMSLVPQIAREVPIPVIAAGGIADGRGIAAALALGADGVQIGTAFLASPEAGAPDAHKRRLGGADARTTHLTRGFTGRLARALPNELMRELDAHLDDVLTYPAQSWLTSPLRKAAGVAGHAEQLALWAGQHAAAARALPAAELLRLFVAETDRALADPRLRPCIDT